MLLIITNSQDVTADYLESQLATEGIAATRINTDTAPTNITLSYSAAGVYMETARGSYSPDDFRNVWYRRPTPLGVRHSPGSSENEERRFALSEWRDALEGYFAHIPLGNWMNHPTVNGAASHKLEQLSRASRLGMRTPATILTQEPTALRQFFVDHNERIIVKPLSPAYIDRGGLGDTVIFTNPVPAAALEDLVDLKECPTLFQEHVNKRIDVRVTVVDGDIHAVGICGLDEGGSQLCDIRRNNMGAVKYAEIEVPGSVEAMIRELVESYRLRFAAMDFAIDTRSEWYFFEINPNGQWAWLDIEGGAKIWKSFARAFA